MTFIVTDSTFKIIYRKNREVSVDKEIKKLESKLNMAFDKFMSFHLHGIAMEMKKEMLNKIKAEKENLLKQSKEEFKQTIVKDLEKTKIFLDNFLTQPDFNDFKITRHGSFENNYVSFINTHKGICIVLKSDEFHYRIHLDKKGNTFIDGDENKVKGFCHALNDNKELMLEKLDVEVLKNVMNCYELIHQSREVSKLDYRKFYEFQGKLADKTFKDFEVFKQAAIEQADEYAIKEDIHFVIQ